MGHLTPPAYGHLPHSPARDICVSEMNYLRYDTIRGGVTAG